ncbi:EamA family transporter [Oculatella sp. LEGE 06141]|uniref:EamA family transporter n=1 Tax=Oculatella sp. LEGE 06141 TaxID=1828648 RepID=UPI00187F69A0|nr:EamA family transporter [Oculatella sp. LEGE 06141]MBE9179534.1 EamA family transporter [Oculatella sp. LEGE 06141]
MKLLRSIPTIPPTSLLFLAIGSTQLGSAIAKRLFEVMNPAGVALLRVGFAAIVLLLLWKPQKQDWQSHWRSLVLFGLALSLMNLTFYLAVERIPLGIGVTIEFIGPLGVAIANSRKLLDGLWVVLAAIGIGLLTPIGGLVLDPIGIALAFLAGGFWAAYILLSARVGRALPGGAGLALAMAVGTVVLLPIGIWSGGSDLLNPIVLLVGFGVALLSSAIPYSFELEALRFLPVQLFGVLLSLEPVAAALIGFIVLGETLSLRAMIAILLVSIAAAGASRFATRA